MSRRRRRSRFRRGRRRTAQQGLEEDDLIDYTPEIKAAALHLARLCRMGPYYVPPSAIDGTSKYHCSWYAPGASGGVNIDGGAAVDPETGMMYVGSQSGLSTTEVGKDPCSEFRYTQAGGNGPRNSCGKLGAPAPPPGYTGPMAGAAAPARGAGGGGAGGGGRAGAAAAARELAGPRVQAQQVAAVAEARAAGATRTPHQGRPRSPAFRSSSRRRRSSSAASPRTT